MPDIKEKLLGLIFVGVVLVGFLLVGWTVQAGDGLATETVFQTGQNTQFQINYTVAGDTNIYPGNGYLGYSAPTVISASYEVTPTYTGNDTWATAVPAMPAGTYTKTLHSTAIVIPNAERFIMTELNVSIWYPADAESLVFYMYHIDANGDVDTVTELGTHYETSTVAHWYNGTFIIPSWNGLQAKQAADHPDIAYSVLYLMYRDNDNLALSAHVFGISLRIEGQPLEAFTMEDLLTIGLFSAGALCWVTALFATDTIDIIQLKKIGAKVKKATKKGRR